VTQANNRLPPPFTATLLTDWLGVSAKEALGGEFEPLRILRKSK